VYPNQALDRELRLEIAQRLTRHKRIALDPSHPLELARVLRVARAALVALLLG